MSAERLSSFPAEPIRRISEVPTVASGNPTDKNGQRYFWDNIIQFPDSWRIPNPQIKIFSPSQHAGIGSKKKFGKSNDIQMHFWNELAVPENYTEQNKEFWRNAKRGFGSRPLELPRTSHFIHERMVKTFNLEGAVEPILTWSVLYDRAKTPSAKFVYEERELDEVSPEDSSDYIVGMSRITEYATNRAVKLFIERNLNVPVLKELGTVYAKINEIFTYELVINGTYRRMARIEQTAKDNGKDYDKAITDALFKHDLGPLDELVADTQEFSGWTGINDLAIDIGRKKWKKPDLAKWTDKLEVEDDNGKVKSIAKNLVASLAAGGVTRSPGISEVSGGLMLILLAETGLSAATSFGSILLKHPETFNTIANLTVNDLLMAQLPAAFLIPFLTLHELIHTYSFDENNYGLIPSTLIHDEKVPYLARLQKKQRFT